LPSDSPSLWSRAGRAAHPPARLTCATKTARPGVTPGHLIPGASVFAFWHRSMIACAHRSAILGSRFSSAQLRRRNDRAHLEAAWFCPVRGSSSRAEQSACATCSLPTPTDTLRITADGPRGPVYVAKPGTALLANSVGAQPAASQPAGTWVGCFHNQPTAPGSFALDRFLIPSPSRAWSSPGPPRSRRPGYHATVQAPSTRRHMAEKEVCASPRFEGRTLVRRKIQIINGA